MNLKQVEAAVLYHAFLNESRDNADYQFTEVEQKRFYRAVQNVRDRLFKMSMKHFDEDVYIKIYGE